MTYDPNRPTTYGATERELDRTADAAQSTIDTAPDRIAADRLRARLSAGAQHAEVAMTEREHEPSVGSLLSGIVGDAQALVRQEIALARQEIREEIDNAKKAGMTLGIAGAVLAI